jgi:hypothetical protein
MLDQVEFADKLGFDYVFEVEASLPGGVLAFVGS